MSPFDWFLIGLWTMGAIATILMVGKQRTVITPGTAAFMVSLDAALIVGLLISRT